jgi:hypothetical protein
MNDTITVTMLATIGQNSTSDEQTLSKICNAWKAALFNSSGRTFDNNNCTWELQTSPQKRAVGDVYLGTIVSDIASSEPYDYSSDESKQQQARILMDALLIAVAIEQSLNPDEAAVSLPIPYLQNDTITVMMTVVIGQNSTSDEQTLSKICDAWKAALFNSSGRTFDSDCTWENVTESTKRAAGNIYLG